MEKKGMNYHKCVCPGPLNILLVKHLSAKPVFPMSRWRCDIWDKKGIKCTRQVAASHVRRRICKSEGYLPELEPRTQQDPCTTFSWLTSLWTPHGLVTNSKNTVCHFATSRVTSLKLLSFKPVFHFKKSLKWCFQATVAQSSEKRFLCSR